MRDERAQVQKQLEISQRACARAEAFGQAFQAKFAAARSGGDPELEAAADATLARIERDLTVEGAPVSGKTLGAPSALPAGKTLGGVTDPIDAPTEARSVQKTIGPAAAPASDVGQAAGATWSTSWSAWRSSATPAR